MFGEVGEAVSMTIKRPDKGFCKCPLQLNSIQSSLVFSFSLKRMQLGTKNHLIKYRTVSMCLNALLIIPIQFVDVVFGLPNVILRLPLQHFNLHCDK